MRIIRLFLIVCIVLNSILLPQDSKLGKYTIINLINESVVHGELLFVDTDAIYLNQINDNDELSAITIPLKSINTIRIVNDGYFLKSVGITSTVGIGVSTIIYLMLRDSEPFAILAYPWGLMFGLILGSFTGVYLNVDKVYNVLEDSKNLHETIVASLSQYARFTVLPKELFNKNEAN